MTAIKMIDKNFIAFIKRGREEKGWSQKEFSIQSGVPYRTLQRIESGTVDCKSLNRLKLFHSLGFKSAIAAIIGETTIILRDEIVTESIRVKKIER